DDKPGTKTFLSNIHQVYGYCLAFKETAKQAQSWLRHAEHHQIEAQITPLLDAAIIREGFEVRGHSVAEKSIDSAPESE
ncbi:MAG: hypothetical protein ACXABY_26650, partial [Candidatus Thorarchaeota archaeon]